MFEMKYPNLFKPLKVGNTVFRNRIVAAPTGAMRFEPADRFPVEAVSFYEQKAKGGAAAVTVSEAYIDREHGRDMPNAMLIDSDACIPNLAEIADVISKYGAIPSIELQHGGMYASASYLEGYQVYAPSETKVVADKAGAALNGVVLPEMPEEVIEETIGKFVSAALRAKRAGFKMVLIHGGHGWLLNQFISSVTNKRTDKWGGSLENRMRLAVTVCDRIKEACGKDFLIEFRMSAEEKTPKGYHLDEAIRIAKIIDSHVDLIHVSVGYHEESHAFLCMSPSMFLENNLNAKSAKEIKKNVKCPVCVVGAITNPEDMEEMIASGTTDFVALGRGLMADPDLPNKARAGRDDDINECMRCYTCYSNVIATLRYGCAINPILGREAENKYEVPLAEKKKIMIAGGGIGGMEAALYAAKLGHEVILCEKSAQLGGVLRCEKDVSFKKKLDLYLSKQEKRVLNNSNIDVRLNTLATAELAKTIKPDAIISVVGAKAIIPTFIKGYDQNNVFSADDIYHDLSKAGKRVVIIGGGLVGCELGIYLAENGRKVTILEMLPTFNVAGNILHGDAILEEFDKYDIKLFTNTKVREIKQTHVIGESKNGIVEYEADTIIYALGQKPLEDEVIELSSCAPEFYSVGDCNIPSNIQQATVQAYYAVKNISRAK